MSGEMPRFLHYGLWDRGHDCGAAGPFSSLPFSLSYFTFLRRLPPRRSEPPHPLDASPFLPFKFKMASFVSFRHTKGPPVIRYWRAIEGIESLHVSKVFATPPSYNALRYCSFTLRGWLLVPGPAGGFLLATTGILKNCQVRPCEKLMEESRTGQASKVPP